MRISTDQSDPISEWYDWHCPRCGTHVITRSQEPHLCTACRWDLEVEREEQRRDEASG